MNTETVYRCTSCGETNLMTYTFCCGCGERLPWATSDAQSANPKDNETGAPENLISASDATSPAPMPAPATTPQAPSPNSNTNIATSHGKDDTRDSGKAASNTRIRGTLEGVRSAVPVAISGLSSFLMRQQVTPQRPSTDSQQDEDTMRVSPVSVAFSCIAVILTTAAAMSSYYGKFNVLLWAMTLVTWFILWTFRE